MLFRDPELGRLGYGQAVKNLFIASVISLILGSAFSILMYGNNEQMEQEFYDYQYQTQLSALDLTADLTGMDAVVLQDAKDELEEQREAGEIPGSYPFKWSSLPLTVAFGSIMYLFISLLLALFVREKE